MTPAVRARRLAPAVRARRLTPSVRARRVAPAVHARRMEPAVHYKEVAGGIMLTVETDNPCLWRALTPAVVVDACRVTLACFTFRLQAPAANTRRYRSDVGCRDAYH